MEEERLDKSSGKRVEYRAGLTPMCKKKVRNVMIGDGRGEKPLNPRHFERVRNSRGESRPVDVRHN